MDDLICAVDADSGAAYVHASHVGDLIAAYESQIAQLESTVSTQAARINELEAALSAAKP